MPVVVCPQCAAKLRVPDSSAGRAAKCARCGTRIPIPARSEPVQSAPSFDFGAPAEGAAPSVRRKPPSVRAGFTPTTWIALAALVLLIVVVAVGGWFVYQTMNRGAIIVIRPPAEAPAPAPEPVKVQAPPTPAVKPPPVKPKEPPTVVPGGAGILYNDYHDVITGDSTYLEKVVVFPWEEDGVGEVFAKASKDEKTGRYLLGLNVLANSDDDVGVICELSPEGAEQWKTANKKGWKFRGLCKGRRDTNRVFTGYEVRMTDCSFIVPK